MGDFESVTFLFSWHVWFDFDCVWMGGYYGWYLNDDDGNGNDDSSGGNGGNNGRDGFGSD